MDREPIVIDGAAGEGGGQVLRTSLALSLVTGRAVRVERIRARRRRSGLMPQHLAAVELAARIGAADVRGAEASSATLEFAPRTIRSGHYRLAIGTAGSTTLVAQAVLPALLRAEGPSTLHLEGGTHNPLAPPADFLQRAFAPLLRRMGAGVEVELVRHGFFPAGGGAIRVAVEPGPLRPIELLERGEVRALRARAIVAGLPPSIGERELAVLRDKLGVRAEDAFVEAPEDGTGNALVADVETDACTEVFAELGRPGLPAERVAQTLVRAVRNHLRSGVPVGPSLADQLLLPLALAGRGAFRTVAPTMHTRTNARVIEAFLPVRFTMDEERSGGWRVVVESA